MNAKELTDKLRSGCSHDNQTCPDCFESLLFAGLNQAHAAGRAEGDKCTRDSVLKAYNQGREAENEACTKILEDSSSFSMPIYFEEWSLGEKHRYKSGLEDASFHFVSKIRQRKAEIKESEGA